MKECIRFAPNTLLPEPDNKIWFYDEGEEFTSVTGGWVAGYSIGTGSQTKESDHLVCYATGSSNRAFVTDNTIDMSDITTIFIDWEIITTGADVRNGRLQVGGGKNEIFSPLAELLVSNAQARQVNQLNVVSVTGNQYIKVFAGAGLATTSTVKVYKVWGEK